MKNSIALTILALFLTSTVFAAGTVTVTMTNPKAISGGAPDKKNIITVDWVSSTSPSGSAEGNIASLYTSGKSAFNPTLTSITGFVRKIETAPGGSGDLSTALPEANYDIAIKDAYGYDIAGGNLANRSGTAAEAYIPSTPLYVASELTVQVTNPSGEKKGRIILFTTSE